MENQALNIPRQSSRSAGPKRAQAATTALLALLCASPLAGQVLRARLLDAGTDTPIAGAFAILEPAGQPAAATGRQVASLSDAAGWVQLRAPARGEYRVRIERLGYRTFVSDYFALDTVLVQQVRLPAEAIQLAAINAQGKRRCGGVTELAAEAATLWDEVRKALAVNRWTYEQRSVSYIIREYSRRLHPRTRKVLEERSDQQAMWTTGSPFVSLGARDLSERGFIRLDAQGGYQYYGPDSDVILSEWFQERHCFRAVPRRDNPALIGLAFEPGPGAPAFDIQGVLWLDRASAQLRYLEYSYPHVPVPVERGAAGGEVHFERLASGRWIVRSWWIRAPVLSRTPGSTELRVAALGEAGRTVVSFHERSGQ